MNNFTATGKRSPDDLRSHPLNDKIYGDGPDDELIDSIRNKGILNPLLITHDNLIISGHRRWQAAVAIGLDSLPVVIFGSTDELDIEEALIESNRQRIKTGEQIGREWKHLKRIANLRDSRQGQRNLSSTSGKYLPEVDDKLRCPCLLSRRFAIRFKCFHSRPICSPVLIRCRLDSINASSMSSSSVEPKITTGKESSPIATAACQRRCPLMIKLSCVMSSGLRMPLLRMLSMSSSSGPSP